MHRVPYFRSENHTLSESGGSCGARKGIFSLSHSPIKFSRFSLPVPFRSETLAYCGAGTVPSWQAGVESTAKKGRAAAAWPAAAPEPLRSGAAALALETFAIQALARREMRSVK